MTHRIVSFSPMTRLASTLSLFLFSLNTIFAADVRQVDLKFSSHAQVVLTKQKIWANPELIQSKQSIDGKAAGYIGSNYILNKYKGDIDAARGRVFSIESVTITNLDTDGVLYQIEKSPFKLRFNFIDQVFSQETYAESLRSYKLKGSFNSKIIRQDAKCWIIRLDGSHYSVHYWTPKGLRWDNFFFSYYPVKGTNAEKFEATLLEVYSDISAS